MQFNTNNRNMYILLGAAILIILAGIITLSVWGSSINSHATPTVSVDAIYTSAYQTVAAAQTAQQASLPTSAPSPSPFPSLPVASPLPINTLVIASPTGAIAQGCDGSTYVSDVTIPDGTTMTPGQTFTKTWAVQNSGTCTWNTAYKLMFVFGTAMNGTSVAVAQSIAPGAQTQLSANLVAPATPGNYTGSWKMQNDKGQYFGTYLTVVINVVPLTATSTTPVTTTATVPADTPTETPTLTPTP